MTVLYVVGPGFEEALVSLRLLQLPRDTRMVRVDHSTNATLAVWRYKPDLVWVFSKDMWEDRTHRWLDAAAAREIPGVQHLADGTQRWWGW